jgi:sulfur carrier protein ThiS
VRFYSPASATTTIEGVCELRLGALGAGVGAAVRYRLEVAVFDSAGLELQRNEWQREVPAAVVRARGATSVETFDFRTAPGRYRVRVRAVPETGEAIEGSVAVGAYAAAPGISDLLLATSVRSAPDDTTPTAPGEVRRGQLVMRTTPLPRLAPTEALLAYYAEIYPWSGAARDGELRVAVLGAGGRTVIETPPHGMHVAASGGLTQGSVDLTGLPTGEYVLRLSVKLSDSTVTAQAPFEMGEMRAVAVTATSQSAAGPDPFAEASESHLDSLYAPLTYLLETPEQGVYRNLAVEGKRRFLPHGADGPQRYAVRQGATVADLLTAIGVAADADVTAAVDGELAARDTPLRDGADVMLLSPMEGG